MSYEYLSKADPEIMKLVEAEEKRQASTLMMIPSENHTSEAVREVVGSLLQDKYCEGYPYKRYYQGQDNFDRLEELCQNRVKECFGVPFCNVQPLSGSPANTAVYFALLEAGDKMMGLRLDQGGHISHGLKVNFSGRFYKTCFYYVGKDGLIDYDSMEKMALEEKPNIIIAGITSYPLALDFERFADVADKCGAYLMADIAHVAGLVLAGVYPNPVPHCHIVNTTTHKTLRGPRGALIMVTDKGLKKDPDLPSKINKAVFPGLQGGPHENNIAGIAVALKEAQKPEFKEYGKKVVENAKALADKLETEGIELCSGGTNTHLLLINVGKLALLGNTAAEALESAGIVANRNGIPYDPNPPFYPSGVRLGTPGVTSRGMGIAEMEMIGSFISRVLKDIAKIKKEMNVSIEQEKKSAKRKEIVSQSKEVYNVRREVEELCDKFPLKKEY